MHIVALALLWKLVVILYLVVKLPVATSSCTNNDSVDSLFLSHNNGWNCDTLIL